MGRSLHAARAIAIAAMCAGTLVPATADHLPVTGTIDVAAVTPEVPKQVYLATPGYNGVTGWVFPLHAGADGRSYTLTKTSSLPGNPDVYFYEDDGGKPGPLCTSIDAEEDGLASSTTETGTICPGSQTARWGIVVLFTGAAVDFSFSITP